MRANGVRCADGVSIAYAVYGGGSGTPLVAMRPPQFSHLEREWEMPYSHHEYSEFGRDRVVIRYDPRGTGVSDREVPDQSLEARLLDLEAVLEAVGTGSVILDAISSAGLTAIAFAARYPERVEKLIIQNAFADGRSWWDEPNRRALLALAGIEWTVCTETWAWMTWGSADSTRNLQLAEHIRACITPADFARMVEAERGVDLRPLLAGLRMPTLVISHPHFARMVPQGTVSDLASAIPAARYVTVQNTSERVRAVHDFIHGREVAQGPIPEDERPHGLPAHPLSSRELEVLRLVAQGLTNRKIAARLVVSVRTIDTHLENVYRKTGTAGRAAATAYAVRNRLL